MGGMTHPAMLQGGTGARLRRQAVTPSRAVTSLADDVLAGLFRRPRRLAPKYFYDAEGSRLFDRICDTPEYYLTRTEDALLARHARDIVAASRPRWMLELGSGFSRKTRHLFDACAELEVGARYFPFDVSAETLMEAGARLTRRYSWLYVHALVGDYLAGLGNVSPPAGRGLVVFLGSTIGNFEQRQALELLREVRALAGARGRLLLGADRVKAPHVLHAAYNDAEGYTARFNRNVLCVINRALGADFDPDTFHHYAPYDPARMQVDMHLVSARAQRVRFQALERSLALAEGEPIHTEVSRKFTREGLESLLAEAGFAVEQHHECAGADARYSLVLARSE